MKEHIMNRELKKCQASERIYIFLQKLKWTDEQILEYLYLAGFNEKLETNADMLEMTGKQLKEYLDQGRI